MYFVYRTRRFKPEDLTSGMQMVAESIREPYKPELFMNAYYTFPPGSVIVEDVRGNTIGVVVAIPTPEYALRILVLVVRSQWRRRGIGYHLMGLMNYACFQYGLRKITLEVRVDNFMAQRFYERLGFLRKGLIKNYYTDKSDGYIYEKILY